MFTNHPLGGVCFGSQITGLSTSIASLRDCFAYIHLQYWKILLYFFCSLLIYLFLDGGTLAVLRAQSWLYAQELLFLAGLVIIWDAGDRTQSGYVQGKHLTRYAITQALHSRNINPLSNSSWLLFPGLKLVQRPPEIVSALILKQRSHHKLKKKSC